MPFRASDGLDARRGRLRVGHPLEAESHAVTAGVPLSITHLAQRHGIAAPAGLLHVHVVPVFG
jgi:hypothetical protein